MVYIYFVFVLFVLFLIAVNRSFIRFHGNTPGHVFLGLLHYSIANVVFVVFKITVCVVWKSGMGEIGFDHGILQYCLRVLTTRLQKVINSGEYGFFFFFLVWAQRPPQRRKCRGVKHYFI